MIRVLQMLTLTEPTGPHFAKNMPRECSVTPTGRFATNMFVVYEGVSEVRINYADINLPGGRRDHGFRAVLQRLPAQ